MMSNVRHWSVSRLKCNLFVTTLATTLVTAALLMTATARPVYAQGATWSVSATPTVRLGIGESEAGMLVAPSGATRLPNGNFVVGDVDEYSMKEYSPQGAFIRKFGRKGQGPGEVTYMFPFLRCGDSLVATDMSNGSLQSVFDSKGNFVRAFRVTPLPYRLSCNANMQFAVMGWESKGVKKEGVYRPLNPFYIARADSSAPTLLGELPGAERMGHRPLALGRDPRMAIGTTRAYVALADSFSILVFDLNGKPLPSFNARVLHVAATKADLTAEMEREIGMMGEKARPSVAKAYATMPLTKYLPATRDLIVDADDHLWVQHFPRAGQALVSWTTFSVAGKALATTRLPAGLEVYEIGRDYVLGRFTDSDEGVPEVRMYTLRRTPAAK